MGAITREELARELVKEAEENGGTLGVAVLMAHCKKRLKEAKHFGLLSRIDEFETPNK